MTLRNRSRFNGWMKRTAEKRLRPGDEIVISKIGAREFELMLERNE